MSENEIVVPGSSYFIAPVTDLSTALRRYQMVKDFINQVLKEGVDYGKVPGGGEKPSLLKPGAEKMASLFGFQVRFILSQIEEDWSGEHHGGEPFFYYRYRCQLWRDNLLIAEGEGSCNSWEKKYRYRQAERVCPNCGKATIIKGKEEYGGGWLCFTKKGGCGAKFHENDPKITGQDLGQVKNPDPADLVNTIQKMAQKRALVAPVLIATNTSDYFTQDIEDYIDAQVTQVAEKTENRQKTAENGNKPAENRQEMAENSQKQDAIYDFLSDGYETISIAVGKSEPAGNKMTLEEASAFLNSDGVPLGELDSVILSGMSASIARRGRKPQTAEQQNHDEQELEAIKVILQARNKPK